MRISGFLFLVLGLMTVAGFAPPVSAQDAVPSYRYVVTRDMDFYGSDLDALFDTDMRSCVQACDANPTCAGFTFNTRSNACFPKSAVTDRTPYEGAFSAEKFATARAVYQDGNTRARTLSFLRSADLSEAASLGRRIGLRHPAGNSDLEAILDAARGREAAGDRVQAMGWTGMAVSLSDRADLWNDYARLLLSIQSNDRSRRRAQERRAVSAAINAYLRGQTAGAQASALYVLAQAFDEVGRGRDMIPTLRLAQSLQPQRSDVADLLDSAVARFGFRITDSTVESDSAEPRICAEFSEPLSRTGVDYEPFVQRPDPSMTVQAEGRKLCVDGLEHGQRYRLAFRSGLPAASGETTHKDVELTHYVRDRSPSVRFPGRSYVLPKSADAALPVQTVNLPKIEMVLRRVSDRNLLRAVQEGYFGKPLSYWEEELFADDIAQEVWKGTGTVESVLNQDMTSRLPMGEAIAGQPAGIYALSARIPGSDPYDEASATQWFVLSDLGLTSMSGTDGLHVTVRGLSDAGPRSGVELTLVSRANAVLGTVTTDDSGYGVFAPGLTRGTGAAAPALVLAQLGEADIGFLSLTDPAFDLSDRGVEGRPAPGPVDVFLTTDRGAYRAGETIHATVLARDDQARAVTGLPLTAILSRPDGVEYRRIVSGNGTAGGRVFALPVGQTVPRGTWRLDIKSDPDAAALASQTILVEDFLPERIDFDQSLPDVTLNTGDSPPLTISARYLFGAPGSDLTIEGNAALRPATTLDGFPGYRFGRYDADTYTRRNHFGGARTDARGNATVYIDLPEIDAVGKPLELTVTTQVADGAGRPVERQLKAPVQPATPVIGIKPLFEEVVSEGSEAMFEVIALSPDLSPMPMPVKWTLNRVETRYQWYQLYGSWNWEPTTRRTRVASGTGDLGAAPLTVAHPVDWGRYELVVERVGGDYVAGAVDFYAGWYQAADASATPDRLEMSLDNDRYQPGDTAQLRIVSRYAGTAMISVLSNRVIERQAVQVTAGETRVPLNVTADWGTGAYVTAAVIRPMDVPAGQNPARALGVAHAAVEPVGKELDVAIETPTSVEPRQTQTARIKVGGVGEGEQAYVTLAAIDVGILNLTGFESPDPKGHYFGQHRLGVELRDVYGRLIDGMNGAMGTVRSGGDEDAGSRFNSPPPTQELMAVFSGPIEVGPDGTAEVQIPLPAFNGTVRMMAVAWTATRVGQAERDMLVRDPVVVTASVPRFLAPGDSSRMRLEVVHADGPSGNMSLALSAGNGLSLGTAPGSFALGDGAKAVFDIPLSASNVGDPQIEVVLTTPDGRSLRQVLNMPVRSNDPVVSQTRRFALGSGDTFNFTNDVFAGLKPGTGKAVLSAGPLARFDAPGLLTALDRYPYGCTEQVTSKAMPLLYLSSVAKATGLGDGPDVQARVDAAIERVLTRQAPNGAFGLWRAESGEFWLDAYVSDFLSRAKALGYDVPDLAFRQAMNNLRNRISYAPDFDHGGQDIAYALMVLAREGAASMSDLRYYADVKADDFATPLATAQIGAALASYGDQTRADAMFLRAARMIGKTQDGPSWWRADFGTSLRDSAGVLSLATEAGSQAIDTESLITRISQPADRLSTQEAAWTLMAAQALVKSPELSGLRVNGAPVDGPFVQVLESASQADGMAISSADGKRTDITLTTMGVPEVPPEAGGTGYYIERDFYSMDGWELESNELPVGERFVTVLRIRPFENAEARLIIDDPLPAGVEIDNPNLLRSGDLGALDWLESSETEHTEFRSDRFIAAVNMSGRNSIMLGYVARAITPGDYHHPAASVEDMYRPRYRARSETGRLVITE